MHVSSMSAVLWSSLQGYVREQALQAVAVIFKRATLDANVIDKEALYSEVTQLIATGDLSLVSGR